MRDHGTETSAGSGLLSVLYPCAAPERRSDGVAGSARRCAPKLVPGRDRIVKLVRKVMTKEAFDLERGFFLSHIPKTKRHRKPAVVRTRFIWARLAFEPFRTGVEGRKPFG